MKLVVRTFFLIGLYLISSAATWAQVTSKTVARVSGIQGNSFVFYGQQKSATLKYGDKVFNLAEIMVEDEGHVTLYDDYGNTFHLAGGTHIKLGKNSVEVKNGKVWVRAVGSSNPFFMKTVNAVADYQQGQFIFSFSNFDGKTQLLVLDGKVRLKNVLEPNLETEVDAGFFSLIDNEYNQGLPRTATRVGLNSYKQAKKAFYGIEEIENTEFESMLGAPSRSIASVEAVQVKDKKMGRVYFLPSRNKSSTSTRIPASAGAGAYYEKHVKNKPHRTFQKGQKSFKNTLEIRIFGGLDQKTTKSVDSSSSSSFNYRTDAAKIEGSRKPASIKTDHVVNDLNNAFEKSLNKKIKIDKRHPEEVNQLIDELKSFDKNFSKSY